MCLHATNFISMYDSVYVCILFILNGLSIFRMNWRIYTDYSLGLLP